MIARWWIKRRLRKAYSAVNPAGITLLEPDSGAPLWQMDVREPDDSSRWDESELQRIPRPVSDRWDSRDLTRESTTARIADLGVYLAEEVLNTDTGASPHLRTLANDLIRVWKTEDGWGTEKGNPW